jgi:transposase
MKNSTARKIKQIPAGYLVVGVDPHKKKHAAVAMMQDAMVQCKFKVDNSKLGCEELIERARVEMERTQCRGVIFAIESASHYWRNLAYLLDDRGIPFRLINQFTLKRRREGKDLNRRKNDFRDAEMAAELLRTGEFIETRLPQGHYAELRAAYSTYRRLGKEKSRILNLIKSLLDGFFPEFTKVFKDPSGNTALSVLSPCPSPRDIAFMKEEEFLEAVKKRHPGNHLMRKKLLALHYVSKASLGIEAGARSVSLELSFLVNRLRLLKEQIRDTEMILKRLVDDIEDSKCLLSITGLGYITVAGILAELGQLRQYNNGKQLIKMAGTNPTESESGGKRGSHTPMSKKGRSGLRWCIWSAAISLLRHNPDFRSWAKERRERPTQAHPLKRREVIGAVGNRLLRLAYTLVKKQEFYHMPLLVNVAK